MGCGASGVIVMDTNVLSELAKPDADPIVVAWANAQPIDLLYTTAITEAEMLVGLASMPKGRRQDALRLAVQTAFSALLPGRILSFDRAAARTYADIAIARRRMGRTSEGADVQIAAIARARGASAIATRNTRDFLGSGVPLVDPWQSARASCSSKLPDAASWAGLTLDRPRIMGVLNVTPDSFSDGGDFLNPDAAIAAGVAMAKAGADIIDVGGESTRPHSQPTTPDIEQARVLPVIRGLASAGLRVSVDTRHGATMAAALDAGARIINDVSALAFDPASAPMVAQRGCPVVLMHMRGTPTTMHGEARYHDVVTDVLRELGQRIAAAERAGIARDAIAIDPGIGFAKKAAHSMELLRRLPELASLGCPILVGVSRKSFLAGTTGEADPRRRLPGSLAAGLFALSRGAAILRVHDVAETVQAIRVWQALSA